LMPTPQCKKIVATIPTMPVRLTPAIGWVSCRVI